MSVVIEMSKCIIEYALWTSLLQHSLMHSLTHLQHSLMSVHIVSVVIECPSLQLMSYLILNLFIKGCMLVNFLLLYCH